MSGFVERRLSLFRFRAAAVFSLIASAALGGCGGAELSSRYGGVADRDARIADRSVGVDRQVAIDRQIARRDDRIVASSATTPPEARHFPAPGVSQDPDAQGVDAFDRVMFWSERHRQNPDDPRSAYGYALSLNEVGSTDEAKESLAFIVDRFPNFAPAGIALARIHIAEENFDLARPLIRRSKRMAPRDWRVHSLEGVLLDAVGNHQYAQQAFRTALRYRSDQVGVLNNLAMSLILSGDIDEARRTLERADDIAVNQQGIGGQAVRERIRANLGLIETIEESRKAEAAAPADPQDAPRNAEAGPLRTDPFAQRQAAQKQAERRKQQANAERREIVVEPQNARTATLAAAPTATEYRDPEAWRPRSENDLSPSGSDSTLAAPTDAPNGIVPPPRARSLPPPIDSAAELIAGAFAAPDAHASPTSEPPLRAAVEDDPEIDDADKVETYTDPRSLGLRPTKP